MSNALDIIRDQFPRLTDEEIVTVLGWIVDPGQDGPVEMGEALSDALYPMERVWRAVYPDVSFIIDPVPGSGEFFPGAGEADYRYEMQREMFS